MGSPLLLESRFDCECGVFISQASYPLWHLSRFLFHIILLRFFLLLLPSEHVTGIASAFQDDWGSRELTSILWTQRF